ncbi:hypothetical protein B0H17DRAFT_436309 [Mycena rosella]|uniref:Thioesterase domain-containing protein n=1 Tax=Mycena rosella TaxID=1033263 RepID=A0AAD7CDR8_MYCRO|nr:hypothetical protein B0H17DRAFT_436309 [Mycena rosella]
MRPTTATLGPSVMVTVTARQCPWIASMRRWCASCARPSPTPSWTPSRAPRVGTSRRAPSSGSTSTTPRHAASRGARRTAVTDVSLAPALPGARAGEDALTVVCEVDITEDSLSGADTLANAVLVAVIDECVSAAVSAHDFARGGPGISGVSLSLNTVFHHPVELGARQRLINTTLTVTPDTTSCRSEVRSCSLLSHSR